MFFVEVRGASFIEGSMTDICTSFLYPARESDKQCKKRKEEAEISSRLVNFALLMYKQLTSEQRYTISVLLQRKCTKNEIAHAIGVSNSTVTRELRRNSSSRGVYKWDKAQI